VITAITFIKFLIVIWIISYTRKFKANELNKDFGYSNFLHLLDNADWLSMANLLYKDHQMFFGYITQYLKFNYASFFVVNVVYLITLIIIQNEMMEENQLQVVHYFIINRTKRKLIEILLITINKKEVMEIKPWNLQSQERKQEQVDESKSGPISQGIIVSIVGCSKTLYTLIRNMFEWHIITISRATMEPTIEIKISKPVLNKKPKPEHFFHACLYGHNQVVRHLLLHFDDVIKVRQVEAITGFTAFHLACAGGHLSVVQQMMFKYGKDTCKDLLNRDGQTGANFASILQTAFSDENALRSFCMLTRMCWRHGLNLINIFSYSFYARSSQKRKNSVKLSVSFYAFVIYWRKSCF